ncbi:MAG: phosphate acetyltransferase [bacterium]
MAIKSNKIIDKIIDNAKKSKSIVVLPEATDPRMLEAAARAVEEGIAEVILIGPADEINTAAEKNRVDIKKIRIIDPAQSEFSEDLANGLFERRKTKGMTLEQARELVIKDPLYFADMMVNRGKAQGCLAGAVNSTGNVVKAALYCVGAKEGVVSSYFLMLVPGFKDGEDYTPFIFADCGVIPNPTEEQLPVIASAAAENRRKVVGDEPRVAMLSFSTKGSAKHDHVDKVVKATEIAKTRYPDLVIDGEFQLDTAVIESIGKRKAPDSKIAGMANVLIFPDLDSGNICYKATERFGKAIAIGPVLQGLNKPCNDLSRGCSADDIYLMIAITAVSA